MTAYAIAHLQAVEFNDEIVKYLEEIDATLEPFGGYFIVHGGEPTIAEGEFTGALIVIAFPDKDAAAGWYASDAYQPSSRCARTTRPAGRSCSKASTATTWRRTSSSAAQ